MNLFKSYNTHLLASKMFCCPPQNFFIYAMKWFRAKKQHHIPHYVIKNKGDRAYVK
jgi:hypothetical protein